jgi:diguanylate cyclase (GGDEF)-like protein
VFDKLSFVANYRLLYGLLFLIVITGIVANYTIVKMEKYIFQEIYFHYIRPQLHLNEIKNIYTTNIVNTINVLEEKKIKQNDAIDVLQLSSKLMDKAWESGYPDLHTHDDLTSKDLEYIKTFKSSMQVVQVRLNDLLQRLDMDDHVILSQYIRSNLFPTIRQSDYLLDDLIAHNFHRSLEAKREGDHRLEKFIWSTLLFAAVFIGLLLGLLQKVGNNLRSLKEDVDQKASNLSSLNLELKRSATTDMLTGLPNRSSLYESLDRFIRKSDQYHFKFAVIFLDLDHFKNINDTLGHDVGDELIKGVANRIHDLLPEGDIIARLGGDEFVIVLREQHDKRQVTLALQHIHKVMGEPMQVNDHRLQVSSSLGVTIYPDDATTIEGLMKNADIAMYKAKKSGRNHFAFFTDEMNKAVHAEIELEQAMPNALNNGEFKLHHQIKVDQDGVIMGAEALIRWYHPTKGIIFPDQFIYLAESTGFIQELGAWIIDESCRTIVRLNDLGFTDFKLSFNASMRQIQHQKLANTLEVSMQKYGVDPKQIKVEITESLLASNIEPIIEELERVNALGVALCMDDFGTGYSSLSFLHQLPLTTLKVDKSFVDHIPQEENTEHNILLDSIVAMARTLNLSVIAEGVEEAYQFEYLKSIGCEYYQGYYFSKAISEEALIEKLQEGQN